jgi:hypothetical protein
MGVTPFAMVDSERRGLPHFLPRSGQAERGVVFPPSPCGGEQRGFGGGAPISPVRYGVDERRVFFFAAGTRKRRSGKWC